MKVFGIGFNINWVPCHFQEREFSITTLIIISFVPPNEKSSLETNLLHLQNLSKLIQYSFLTIANLR
jgi:hypothetical protein